MNGTKKIEHHETVTGSIPSQVALENERRVVALEEGHKDLVGKMGEMVTWMRKIEGSVENLAGNINLKLEKITHRPAGTYIGIISLIMGAIGSAAALIVFVQDARLEPIRAEIRQIHQDDDDSFAQWKSDFESMIRNSQILEDHGMKGSVDSQNKKNYTRPKYHARPAP